MSQDAGQQRHQAAKGREFAFEIPGKIMINGGYLVLEGEEAFVMSLGKRNQCRAFVEELPNGYDVEITTNKGDRAVMSSNPLRERRRMEERGYLFEVGSAFFEITGYSLESSAKKIRVEIVFDKHNFVQSQPEEKGSKHLIKTGLGTSGIIVVAVVTGLLLGLGREVNKREVFSISRAINLRFSPRSSCSDIYASVFGTSVISNMAASSEHRVRKRPWWPAQNMVVLLGTFGQCTRTLVQINKTEHVANSALKEVNRKLISAACSQEKVPGDTNMLYAAYLEEMRASFGEEVVPQRQYALLKETLGISGVHGSGIPGAGGEDAFWVVCSAEAKEEVVSLWRGRSVHDIWEDTPDFAGLSFQLKEP